MVRFLCSALRSVGIFMNAVGKSSHHPEFVVVTNSRGRSSLRLCAPPSLLVPSTTIALRFIFVLLCNTIFLLEMVGRCFLFMTSWSFGYSLCGPCFAAGILWHLWFLLLG
jgi:hypothetical protein